MPLRLAEAAVTRVTKYLVFLKNIVTRRIDAPSVLHGRLMQLSHTAAQAVSTELLTAENSLLGFLLAGPRGAAQHHTRSERVAHPSLDPLGTRLLKHRFCFSFPLFPWLLCQGNQDPTGKIRQVLFQA